MVPEGRTVSQTVVGIVCDQLGLASREELRQGHSKPELYTRAWATPSSGVRSVQDERIPIDYGHDGRWLGEVVHFERHAGNLWAVGELDEPVAPFVPVCVREGETTLVPHPLYWSAERIGSEEDGFLFTSLAITPYPAQTSARPLDFLDGALDYRGAEKRWSLRAGFQRDLLQRAAEARYERRVQPGSPIVVYDESGVQKVRHAGLDAPPAGRLRFRSSSIEGVDFPDRTIELIVAPAEEPALVKHQGRMVTETIAYGAFAGCEKRAGRIRVNREHDVGRTIGRVVALDPFSELGLAGRVQVARTELGDETLALAAEDCLDASAGFLPRPGGEKWLERNRVRITDAWLGHVALVAEPAYEGARVLSVRSDS